MYVHGKGFLTPDEIAEHQATVASLHDETKKALRLYSIDNAAARSGKCERPHISDYTRNVEVNGRRELAATDYAKSRFHELPKTPARRKRNVSPAAKARHIARDRARRAAMA